MLPRRWVTHCGRSSFEFIKSPRSNGQFSKFQGNVAISHTFEGVGVPLTAIADAKAAPGIGPVLSRYFEGDCSDVALQTRTHAGDESHVFSYNPGCFKWFHHTCA